MKDRVNERSGTVWNTDDEIEFIHTIGTGINGKRFLMPTRGQALKNYREVLLKRDIWDGPNKEIVINYIREEIENGWER